MDGEVRRAARDAILRRRDEYGMSAVVATNDTERGRQQNRRIEFQVL